MNLLFFSKNIVSRLFLTLTAVWLALLGAFLFHWVQYPDPLGRLYVFCLFNFCVRLACEPCKVGRNTPMLRIGDSLT